MSVADGLRNLTFHPHPQRNEWVISCLVCGKSYDQVIEETVADYFDQTAQPGETVRERQIKRNDFIDGIQSGVFTFIPPGVSLAAIYRFSLKRKLRRVSATTGIFSVIQIC